MSQEPDYYAILQVHPNAEPEVIEAAYRRLAAKYHPDVNPSPDATARMQAINDAHRVLSDPSRRAAYDARRARAVSRPASPDAPRTGPWQQARHFVAWFVILMLLGELYQRVGGRGLLILLALAGVFYLLWKSRRIF
ncbi:MAG: J domain-containing protein [Anaerolineae bacterium]